MSTNFNTTQPGTVVTDTVINNTDAASVFDQGMTTLKRETQREEILNKSARRYFFSPVQSLFVGDRNPPVIAGSMWITKRVLQLIENQPYARRDDGLEKPEGPHIFVQARTRIGQFIEGSEPIDTGNIQDTHFASHIEIELLEAYGGRGGAIIRALDDQEPKTVNAIQKAIWTERDLSTRQPVMRNPSTYFKTAQACIDYLEQIAPDNIAENLADAPRLLAMAEATVEEMKVSLEAGKEYAADWAARMVNEMAERMKPNGTGRGNLTKIDEALFLEAGLPIPSTNGGDNSMVKLIELLSDRLPGLARQPAPAIDDAKVKALEAKVEEQGRTLTEIVGAMTSLAGSVAELAKSIAAGNQQTAAAPAAEVKTSAVDAAETVETPTTEEVVPAPKTENKGKNRSR